MLVEALGGESGTLISSMPLLLEVERRRRGDLDRRRRFDRLSFFERREDRERDRRFDRFLWLWRERDRDLKILIDVNLQVWKKVMGVIGSYFRNQIFT